MKEEDIKAYDSALVTATTTEKVKVEKELIIESQQFQGQWRLRVYDGRNLVLTVHRPDIKTGRRRVRWWIHKHYTVIGE